jgi:DNA topoisomerase IA
VTIEAQGAKKHLLRASGQVLKFAGWLEAQGASERAEEVAGEESVRDGAAAPSEGGDEEKTLPMLAEGEGSR